MHRAVFFLAAPLAISVPAASAEVMYGVVVGRNGDAMRRVETFDVGKKGGEMRDHDTVGDDGEVREILSRVIGRNVVFERREEMGSVDASYVRYRFTSGDVDALMGLKPQEYSGKALQRLSGELLCDEKKSVVEAGYVCASTPSFSEAVLSGGGGAEACRIEIAFARMR